MSAQNEVSQAFVEAIDRRIARKKAALSMKMTFREFLESDQFARPYLDPRGVRPELYTDVGWAIIDASDGVRPSLDDKRAEQIFGCVVSMMPIGKQARIVTLGAGRGSGKTSRFLATKCIHSAWTADLSLLAPGEEAAAVLIGPKRRHAKQTFRFVIGLIRRSPILSAAVARDERGRMMVTRESITIDRPDGARVRIEVTSAARGGEAARGFTIVFAGLEEACFFAADPGAAVNDQAVFDGLRPRLARGASVWIVSTPWVEGEGLMEELIAANWGKHAHALVVARVPTRWLNPLFDPDGADEAAQRSLPGGDINADRELLAIPLPKGSRSFFDAVAVAEALQMLLPEYAPIDRSAGSDLGFTKDSAALGIIYAYDDGTYGSPALREVSPGKGEPLIPSKTCTEFAVILRGFEVASVWADRHYSETYKEHLEPHRVTLRHPPDGHEAKIARYTVLQVLLAKRRFRLGSLPEKVRESLRVQLNSITAVNRNGKIVIIVPRTTVADLADGKGTTTKHADAVSALIDGLFGIGAEVVSAEEKKAAEATTGPKKPLVFGALPGVRTTNKWPVGFKQP